MVQARQKNQMVSSERTYADLRRNPKIPFPLIPQECQRLALTFVRLIAGDGGIEPPTAVLETAGMPLT